MSRRPAVEPLEARALLASLVVNTTGDGNDPTAITLSLREAIEVSNGTLAVSALSAQAQAQIAGTFTAGVPNTINFNIPGSGIQTISITGQPLPALTAPAVINGYSQPSASTSTPDKTEVDINNALIQIDGSALPTPPTGTTYDGLAITTANCQVDGLIVTGFHDAGISISGAGSQGNWLWGNFIGALPDPTNGKDFEGTPALGNLGEGIRITSSNNRVGGNTPGLPNVISNNGFAGSGNPAGVGLLIDTAGGTGNLVEGNIITANAAQGVFIASSNNTIGEALTGGGNVISGNGADGIEITGGSNVQGNLVLGNFIGTDLGTVNNLILKGSIAYPNQGDGVLILNSPRNFIGGAAVDSRNIIGENGGDGVAITGAASTGNHVLNNYLGFNVINGLIVYLPNRNGVSVTAPGNTIGDPSGSSPNTIDDNYNNGILISGSTTSGNTIAGNVIGLNPDGGSAFPNSFDGVHIDNAPNNIIGGTTSGARNTISSNNNGVYIIGAGATGNQVEGNFIGTAADGITDLGNAVDGVVLDNAPGNTIGGTVSGAGNVISGNNRGVQITGVGSTGNAIEGNFIGTDLTGKAEITNKIDGVLVTSGASNNTIGGLSAGAGNTIEDNVGAGVNVDSGTGNAIYSNDIANNTQAGIVLNPANTANNLQPAPVLSLVTPNATSTFIQGTLNAAANTSYTLQFFASPTQPPLGLEQGQTPLYTATLTTDNTGKSIIAQQVPQVVPSGQWVTATATDPTGNTSVFSAAAKAVPVGVQFSAATYSVSESGGSALITVTRNGDSNGTDSVSYSIGGGSGVAGTDYLPASGTLTFSPNVSSQTFMVPVIDAKKVGGSVTVNLTLSNPTNVATLGNPSVSTLTILDDDKATVQLGASAAAVNENAGGVQFTVTRNSPVGTATVQYATADGTAHAGVNFTASSGTVTFQPGQTSQTITVPVLDDGVVTGPLKFSLALSNPVNSVLGPPASETVTVINTDSAGGTGSYSLSIVVNTTADTADPTGGNTLSLREAIALSDGTLPLSALTYAERALVTVSPILPTTGNSSPVPNTINFALPGSGIQTIQVSTPLPAITAPVLINGYTQPGSSTSPTDKTEVDLNNPLVRIDGSALPTPPTNVYDDGLAITTSNCEVSGLIITGFHDAGISISGAGSQGNWLWGNFLGALPDTTSGKNFEVAPSVAAGLALPQIGNQGEGIRITSSNNRVGGDTPGLPNVMANNGYDAAGNSAFGVGLLLDGLGATGNLIQGNVVVNNADQGILIHSSNNTIGEALTGGGNVISGNGGAGVEITDPTGGSNVQGNQLLGNFIGTDLGSADGSIVKGTLRLPNKAQGVLILNSPKNTIGGYAANARNVIGMNLLDGVEIDGATSTGNRLLSNYIGFNVVSGVIALLPNQNGVSITAPGNFVGDSSGNGGNTISNNRNQGVLLLGAGASGNTIAGNVIGLNPDGGSAFPNAFNGIYIDNAPNNIIGGTAQGARNTISSNNNGVYILGAGSTGNLVLGNFIGTATDGVTDLGNAVDGVVLDNAPLNTIGGTATGAANVISGNNRGVRITGVGSSGDLIEGNFIGTDLTAKVVLANKIDGVLVTSGASNNTIGGTASGAGNTIAYNAGEGVNIDSGTGNAILSNAIYTNNAPGGIALNAATSANKLQAAPVLSAVISDGTNGTVQGTLTAEPNATYTLQFFSSDSKDPSGFGQGQTFLFSATLTSDATGKLSFTLGLPTGIKSGQWITATATDITGNTSAFSNALLAVPVSFQLGAASYTTTESAGVVAITVTRTGGQGGGVAVSFNVSGGSATAGVDYTPVNGTLYFNPGDPATKTFTIPILDAAKVGGSVNVGIALGSPTNGATLGSPAGAMLTIQDSDQPAVSLAPGPYNFSGPGVAYFSVIRNTPNGTATVHYTTSDGTALAGVNYVPTSGTLTFSPGQTSATVPVTILDDNQFHAAPLSFSLALSQASGAAISPIASVTATDATPNAPGAFQIATASTIAPPGSSFAAVTIIRTGGKTGTVTVAYATGGGTARPGIDYSAISGTLTFGPGETSKVVNVPVFNTTVPGTSPNFLFGLGSPTNGATLGAVSKTTVTILHPVSPTLPVSNASPTVAGILPVAGASGFHSLVITFNKPMNAIRASTLTYYALTLNGQAIPIGRAVYNPTTYQVTLALGATVPFGVFPRIDIRNLADASGRLLDGSGTGLNPGSPYSALIGEGRQLVYTDRSGDAVNLTLSGPGYLDLIRSLNGEALSLRFVGTQANVSTLTGAVVARPGSAGTTSIPSISGASGVKIRLASPPFYLGGITASAVDALAVSGSLKARS